MREKVCPAPCQGAGEKMSEFAIGDQVVLLSGGPVMTVTNEGGGEVELTWFADDDRLQKACLPVGCVELFDAEKHCKKG